MSHAYCAQLHMCVMCRAMCRVMYCAHMRTVHCSAGLDKSQDGKIPRNFFQMVSVCVYVCV